MDDYENSNKFYNADVSGGTGGKDGSNCSSGDGTTGASTGQNVLGKADQKMEVAVKNENESTQENAR